jgi:pimeloyl-ACP methyl ester carboxylesterase
MHVHRYGSGENCFLGLHGWGGTHSTFEPLAAFLPADSSLYAADLPGYGLSPAPAHWRLEAIAGEVAEELLKIGRGLTVIGNCSGAILALLAASRGLDVAGRISRFVMIDPFAFMPWYFKLFVTASFGRAAYITTFANPAGRWVTNLSLKRRRSNQSDLTRSFARIDHEVAYRYLEMLNGLDSIDQFKGLRMPVEIIHGEKSFAAVRRSVEMWKKLWPRARAIELAGVGHLPIEEAPRRLSEIIFKQESRLAHPALMKRGEMNRGE